MSSLPETSSTILPPDYKPGEKEKFMNPVMLEYFRQKLLRWRAELLEESTEPTKEMQEDNLQKPDIADRASAETDHALELRTRDRERKLISKINAALEKIEDGSYAYCEETGTRWPETILTNPTGSALGTPEIVDLGTQYMPTGYTFTFVGYIVEQGDSKRTVSKLINDDGAEAQIVSIP